MRAKRQVGYTILEVLIFIAVSSLMFISAMRAISGRQRQVQFTQSIQEFDAKIKDLINDVTTSYYPTNENVSCEIIGSEISISKGSDQKLGTNKDCIYVGKAINFQTNNDTAMHIFALAGKRYSDTKLTPSTSISDARPKAVTSLADNSFIETYEEYIPLYGLKITRVMRFIDEDDFTDYGSIAIMSNFGGSSISEAQAVQIGGILGSNIEDNDLQSSINIINQITDNPGSGTPPPTGYFEKNTDEGVVICLESPEGKKASLTVGINSGSSTLLQVDDYNKGCDAI